MASQVSVIQCLTCTRLKGSDYLNIQNGENSAVSVVLRKYFWFTEIDLQEAAICQTCWDQVNQFHKFYVSVEELCRIRLTSVFIKSEPVVVENSDCLKNCQPATSDAEQLESSMFVKEEPALDIVDENESSNEQPTDTEEEDDRDRPKETQNLEQAECRRSREQWQLEDDFVREHVKFSCKQCGEDSPSFALFAKHSLDEHANISPFIECCGKNYYRRDRLYNHVQVVNNPDIFHCKECEKRFSYESVFQRHMKVMHATDNERKFKCDRCSRTFAIESNYKRHFDAHLVREGIKPRHACTACPSSFNDDRILRRHIAAVHSGNAPNCQLCRINFTTNSAMYKHMRTAHPDVEQEQRKNRVGPKTDGTKFKCDRCPQTFPYQSRLTRHINGHLVRDGVLTKQTYSCTDCPRSFRDAGHLKDHIAVVHKGISPYTCSLCEWRFNSRGNLHNHKKRAHPNE